MKMKSKFFGINAKIALAALAVCGMFTSCYEKEDVDVTTLPDPEYFISCNITDASTGQAMTTATVTLDGSPIDVTTKKKVDYKAEGYTLKVSATGYYEVTRQVYLSTVAGGQTSIATVNVALVSVGTVTIPPVVSPDDPSTDIDETEAGKIADEVGKTVTPSDKTIDDMLTGATATAEEKKELDKTKELAGTITFGETTATAQADGSILAVTPVAFATPVKDAAIYIPYFQNDGCEIAGDVKEATAPTTRAIGDVAPADIKAAFLANAAKALKRNAGFTQKIGYAKINVLEGFSILGYNIKGKMVSKKLTFLISGKYYAGIVTYQESVMIFPRYYNHNTHDSHDSHGFNPNAGGGSND